MRSSEPRFDQARGEGQEIFGVFVGFPAVKKKENERKLRRRTDKRGVDLISDALPFGALWYAGTNAIGNAIGYAQHRGRSNDSVIRAYDEAVT